MKLLETMRSTTWTCAAYAVGLAMYDQAHGKPGADDMTGTAAATLSIAIILSALTLWHGTANPDRE